jgi:hypothetical protein
MVQRYRRFRVRRQRPKIRERPKSKDETQKTVKRTRRRGPSKGGKRSLIKVRKGSLGLNPVLDFFQSKFEAKGLARNTPIAKISAKHKAAWLADTFKRSSAKRFDQLVMEKVILPSVLENPSKFAGGLGRSAKEFFRGLDGNAELFFSRLGDEGKLQQFLKRLWGKNHLAYCNAHSLGLGIAKHSKVFFGGLGGTAFNLFSSELRRAQKTQDFLSGIRAVLGADNPEYLRIKNRLL